MAGVIRSSPPAHSSCSIQGCRFRFKVYWGLKMGMRAMCVVSASNKS